MADTLHYYAQRKTIDNGVPETPSNMYGTRRQMERQYCLYRANALEGEEFAKDLYSIEWGTLETGAVDRIVYKKEEEPTPEPEPEGEGEDEGGEEPNEPTEPTEGE